MLVEAAAVAATISAPISPRTTMMVTIVLRIHFTNRYSIQTIMDTALDRRAADRMILIGRVAVLWASSDKVGCLIFSAASLL